MSILLDALRKSEEQRQLGKVPDIHSPAGAELMAAAGRRRWVLLILAGGVALSATWFAWEKFRQPNPTSGSGQAMATAAESTPADAPAIVASNPAPQESDEAGASSAPAARRTPVETLPADATGSRGAAIQPQTVAQQGEPQKSRVNQSFTAFEAAAPVAPEQNEPKQAAPEAPAQREAQLAALAQAGSEAVAAPGQSVEGSDRPAPPQPPATEPISFWELPQGVRDSLPELRITVLVYAERPEDRFLLLGGQRMREKDEYQGGVVLDEIRRDGAVFLYRNYRFLVKG
jgi:general secretion pathway protein B